METQQAPASLDEVRLAVLRQHTQLGQLLDELEAHAKAVIGGAVDDEGKPLDDALALLLARFTRHIDYEEAHLAQWIPPAKRGKLLGDHEEQRRLVRGLAHDRGVFGDPQTIAREALAFVHTLRKDMVDEEEQLRPLR